jgi:hypothetical protein
MPAESTQLGPAYVSEATEAHPRGFPGISEYSDSRRDSLNRGNGAEHGSVRLPEIRSVARSVSRYHPRIVERVRLRA